MQILLAVAVVLGYGASLYFYPRYWQVVLAVTCITLLPWLFATARRRVTEKGGVRLWLKWLRLRLRPALTNKAKDRKAADTVAVLGAIDNVHRSRQREKRERQQRQLRREVRKIADALAPLRERYAEHAFVEFRFLDDGVCFCVSDDQPYAHEDLYAILAAFEDHGRRRSRVTYTARKGQMLEDKEVFPAHVSPPRYTSLRKAKRVLAKELSSVVEGIASRSR